MNKTKLHAELDSLLAVTITRTWLELLRSAKSKSCLRMKLGLDRNFLRGLVIPKHMGKGRSRSSLARRKQEQRQFSLEKDQ